MPIHTVATQEDFDALLATSTTPVVALFQNFSGGGRDLIPTFGDFAARFAANARFVAVDTGIIHGASGETDAPESSIRVFKQGKLMDTARNGSPGAIQSLLAKYSVVHLIPPTNAFQMQHIETVNYGGSGAVSSCIGHQIGHQDGFQTRLQSCGATMFITTITKLKEWESMLGGPHPVAVLFTDSSLGEVRNFNVLDRALHNVAQHHPEKARYLTVDVAKVQDVATAAGVTSGVRLQVYKHGKPAGQPLLPETYANVEDAEPVLLRHIQKSAGQ